jgi:AcrR family transcriptional regulator
MLGTPTRDRQTERRKATRQEIIDAAWDVAREKGLAELTLRDVATRVGMQAPSLYSHFASKNAIYDAMFEQAWGTWEQLALQGATRGPKAPRARVAAKVLEFFDFAVADLARYQLMNQRTISGFEPSPEAYAASMRALERDLEELASMGVTDRGDIEILFALTSGLIDQQLANDPGGDSRRRLVKRAVEMWADGAGLPPTRTTTRTRK